MFICSGVMFVYHIWCSEYAGVRRIQMGDYALCKYYLSQYRSDLVDHITIIYSLCQWPEKVNDMFATVRYHRHKAMEAKQLIRLK